MRVCIISAVWKRPEVFEIFAESIKSLKGDIVVCIAGSEGDKSRKMVESHGFEYVETPNEPLGVKMNQAAILASKTDADYYLMMGSDDILNQALYDQYLKAASKGFDYIYVTEGYFYDTVSKKALYWSGYKKDRAVGIRRALGCGRLISRKRMERVRWMPWMNDKYHDLLDTGFDEKMRLTSDISLEIKLKGTNMAILDIKSSTNMTPFAPWDNTTEISKESIFQFFPKNIVNLLK